MARDKIETLLRRKKSKSFQDLAVLLTEIDRLGIDCLRYQDLQEPETLSFRLGITGPPGAGKSTLITQIIKTLSEKGIRIGVLAVDPSSPFSGGALLGDRIRYQEALENPNVFVRSIGSRGSLGGLSASSYLMLRAYDVWNFDLVLIETVGVGQTELEIMNVADKTAVVLVPESGDGIQTMKAGLMEIANLFVVNKSDRPGAQSLCDEIQNELHARGTSSQVPILQTSATQNQGVSAVVEWIQKQMESDCIVNRKSNKRIQSEAVALLRGAYDRKILMKAKGVTSIQDILKLKEYFSRIL